jgi:inhibitor of KinA
MLTPPAEAARFQRASDQALLIYFGHQITLQAHENVRRLLRLIELQPIAGVRNLHPAYCSVLVKFDALKLRHDDLEKVLKQYLHRLETIELPKPREIEIPVCYGGAHGPDLMDVSTLHKMMPDQVIKLHSSTSYVVYFIGFVPGFAYLGELPPALVTSRLPTPRRNVPRGSVGIAGNQTGIYPVSTPGGWRLLGRTPVAMFQPERDQLSLLSIGDRVRFTRISHEQFVAMERP